MLASFKVGDKVRLRKDSGLRFAMEEAKLGKTYTIESVNYSKYFKDYVQLRGIYSSYKFEWIEKYEKI